MAFFQLRKLPVPSALATLFAAGLSLPAGAAEYYFDPFLSLSALYESNPRLRQTVDDSAGGVFEAALGLGARSPVSLIAITPRIQEYRYDDDTLDRTDQELGVELERALSSTFKTGLKGDISRISTLVSEAEDTGLVGNRKRDMRAVEPYLSWKAGVRDELFTRFSYTDNKYDEEDVTNSGLVDHDFRIVTLGWNREWTQATSGYVEAFGSEYRNREADCRTESLGGRVGLKVALTPTLMIDGSLGYVSSDLDLETFSLLGPPAVEGGAPVLISTVECRSAPVPSVGQVVVSSTDSASSDDVLAGVRVKKDLSSISSVSAGYERSIAASGRGVQTIRDRYFLTVDQALNERVKLAIDGSFRDSQAEAGDGGGQERNNKVTQIAADLRYTLSEETYVGIGYRYRWRNQDASQSNGSDSSENHIGLITFGYDIKARTLLR